MDKGIEFHWHDNNSNKLGFFGWDSSGFSLFYSDFMLIMIL